MNQHDRLINCLKRARSNMESAAILADPVNAQSFRLGYVTAMSELAKEYLASVEVEVLMRDETGAV